MMDPSNKRPRGLLPTEHPQFSSQMFPLQPSGGLANAPARPVLKPKACTPCRTRKVKCDRKLPCENCRRWLIECNYPSPLRKCRRPQKKAVEENSAYVTRSATADITPRLDWTAQWLAEIIEECRSEDIQLKQSSEISQHVSEAASSLQAMQASLTRIRELLSGKNNHRSSNNNRQVPNPTSPRPFPFQTFGLDVAAFHPLLVRTRLIWAVFRDSIDPLVKVLHYPSTDRLLCKADQAPTSLNNAETAILFTIYFSTLSALSDKNAEEYFKTSKASAMAAYREATEQALVRANLTATDDLTTLQAFVLFLSLGRFKDDGQSVWASTCLAGRLEDIPKIGSSPFEDEIRRRLRWELWYLDHRAHEDRGNPVVPNGIADAQKLPTNAKDIHISPAMECAPIPDQGWSEISFSLIRFEIADFSRKVDMACLTREKELLIDECEKRIERQYLRFCDGSKPIHWLAQHVSFVLIMEMRFRLHLQIQQDRQQQGVQEHLRPGQDELFLAAIDIVDTPTRIAEEPQAKRWCWLLKAYTQFGPLSFLLEKLCTYSDCCELVDRAWRVAEAAFARQMQNNRFPENMKILSRLMSAARARRQAEIFPREADSEVSSRARCAYGPSSDCLLRPAPATSFDPTVDRSSVREEACSSENGVEIGVSDPLAMFTWSAVDRTSPKPHVQSENNPFEYESRDLIAEDTFWYIDGSNF